MKEQRMYSITLRSLSGISKGIQSAHAIVEYGLKYNKTPEFIRWAKKDKTLIILQAGTNTELNETYYELKQLGVKVTKFKEPDLGNITTAITFLLDKSIWGDSDTLDHRILQLRWLKNQFSLGKN